MNKHSKLPLHFTEKIGAMKEPVIELHSADGFYIGGLRRPFSGQILAPDATNVMRANAAHIVLCVNSHDALVQALQEARSWIIGQADKDEDPEHWDIVKSINTALAAVGAQQ